MQNCSTLVGICEEGSSSILGEAKHRLSRLVSSQVAPKQQFFFFFILFLFWDYISDPGTRLCQRRSEPYQELLGVVFFFPSLFLLR